MMENDIAQEIKKANRDVYNEMSPEDYNKNESIFNEKRKTACGKILENIAAASGKERFADIGCGSGNLLRIAVDHFDFCLGLDISEKMLGKIKNDFQKCFFVASDAENLPIKSESFNCISCYAMLHHLYSHEKLFSECQRILKKGGTLYTDHDPNYFFNRFYHVYYRMRFAGKHGFGSQKDDLAEYHNVFTPGINPENLKEILLKTGFSKVEISYRITDRETWSPAKKLFVAFLRGMTKFIHNKSLYTHFSIIAEK
jgi:ubiquinone/menaquinone biosynthesis C-methylase UbiE